MIKFHYADNIWLHCNYHSIMISFYLLPNEVNQLIDYLEEISNSQSELDLISEIKISNYKVSFEGPDEDCFNILISQHETVIIFSLLREELKKAIYDIKSERLNC